MINITNTLKPEQLNHQMAFCIWGRAYWIQNGKLNKMGSWTLWLKTIGLAYGIPESSKCPKILKSRCYFYLRRLLDLGSTSLKQNLILKTLSYLIFILSIFLIYCLAVSWPTFAYYWGNKSHSPAVMKLRLGNQFSARR